MSSRRSKIDLQMDLYCFTELQRAILSLTTEHKYMTFDEIKHKHEQASQSIRKWDERGSRLAKAFRIQSEDEDKEEKQMDLLQQALIETKFQPLISLIFYGLGLITRKVDRPSAIQFFTESQKETDMHAAATFQLWQLGATTENPENNTLRYLADGKSPFLPAVVALAENYEQMNDWKNAFNYFVKAGRMGNAYSANKVGEIVFLQRVAVSDSDVIALSEMV